MNSKSMENHNPLSPDNERQLLKRQIRLIRESLAEIEGLTQSGLGFPAAKLTIVCHITSTCTQMLYGLLRLSKGEVPRHIIDLVRTATESLDEVATLVEQPEIDVARAREKIIRVSTIAEMLRP